MKKRLVCLAIMAVTGCVAGPQTAPTPSGALAAAVHRDGLVRVEIRGRDGGLTVRPAAGDSVVVRVGLSSSCRTGEEHTLRAGRDAGVSRLEVTPSTKDRCEEAWVVELPSGIGLMATLDRADVDLHLGGGELEVSVGKGDIDARVETREHGPVRLAAEVGRVTLVLDGREVRHPREPGPGDWVALEGGNGAAIRLETTVGGVRLRLDRASR